MSYKAYVCQIKNLRDHPNADRLYLGECFGNVVAVSKEGYYADMVGIYFPTDLQLSTEFCQHNNLLRLKDENGHSIPGGGYMDPDKRNVTAIKLRGEKSDGLFLPLSCLDYCFTDVEGGAKMVLNIGDTIDVVNGRDICTKYIPKRRNKSGGDLLSNGNKVKSKRKRVPVAPLFAEHADTEQLAYNLKAFKGRDEIEITLKMHGTSQRTGYLPVLCGYHRTLWDRLFRRDGSPIYNYDLITGTRRTVIENEEGGFYGDNTFRFSHAEKFRGKLWKGETAYYEVVGFTNNGIPIMPTCHNKKLNDKEFVKQYGETTTFSYGCSSNGLSEPLAYWDEAENEPAMYKKLPQSDIYVYRMTMTNEDGNVVEYTPDFMRCRCEQMGIKTVPVFWRGNIPEEEFTDPGEWVKGKAEEFYDGPDPIGKTHVREGVVVRLVNKPKFTAYKHKNFMFKVLSGIASAQAEENGLTENMDEDMLAEM